MQFKHGMCVAGCTAQHESTLYSHVQCTRSEAISERLRWLKKRVAIQPLQFVTLNCFVFTGAVQTMLSPRIPWIHRSKRASSVSGYARDIRVYLVYVARDLAEVLVDR